MKQSAQPNQSVLDGIVVLQALIGRGGSVGTRELARELQMDTTRVSRLLMTLAHAGLARQDEKRKYLPGPGIHVLAAQALVGESLLRSAVPVLEALRRYGHIVALGVLWHDKICYLYHTRPGMPPESGVGHTRLFHAAHSGIGHALMARESDAATEQRLTRSMDAAQIRQVIRNLAEHRKRGYARVNQPANTIGLGMALPGDSAAAICFSGHWTADQEPELVAALHAATTRISTDYPTNIQPKDIT